MPHSISGTTKESTPQPEPCCISGTCPCPIHFKGFCRWFQQQWALSHFFEFCQTLQEEDLATSPEIHASELIGPFLKNI